MRIAVASLGNPASMKTWSGIPAHIFEALKLAGYDVCGITLKSPKQPWYYNWLRRYHYRINKKWFLAAVETTILKKLGKELDEEVLRLKPDVVLVIHGDLLAYTTFSQPACIIHDTTFASLLEYYSAFTNLTLRSITLGNKMYQRALDRADAAVFSAQWASSSAINDYHANPSKIHTIPFGANLMNPPTVKQVNEWKGNRMSSEVCRLLFLGIDWERKGGPDALRFTAHLNKIGIPATLTIAGCTPVLANEYKQYVNIVGFLRKDVPADSTMLETLLEESHALLLPSLAECYGCVYCEANAYGLPALGRDTGGIPEIIKDGYNGLLLRMGETAEQFAERWAEIWKEKEIYDKLCRQSRTEFEELLNYTVFTQKLGEILNTIVLKHRS